MFQGIPAIHPHICANPSEREQKRKKSSEDPDDAHKNRIALLAEKAKAGNKPALEELITLFHHDIFRMVYYRLRSRMDAEDLTQEIFMQIVRSLPDLKDVRRFKPWLYRIALNRVRDFYRKKKILIFFGKTAETDPADQCTDQDSHDPVHYVIRKEFWHQLQQFADCLSRWEREIFMLRFMDHLELREIADALGKNENTVKTHLYRALKKFKGNSELRNLLKGEAL